MAVGLGFGKLCARLIGLRRGAGYLGALLGELPTHGGRLGRANARHGQAGLDGGKPALRRLHATLCRRHGRGLLVGGRRRLPALPFRHRARLREPCVGFPVEEGELIGRLLLRELRLGRRQLGFRLSHAAGRIAFGLFGLELRLIQLFLEDADALARRFEPRFRLPQNRPGLILARPDLLIVEHRNRVARIDRVALADSHLDNAAARPRRNRRIVAFDAAAEHDDVLRRPRGEEAPPQHDRRDHENGERDDEHHAVPARCGRPCGSRGLGLRKWCRQTGKPTFWRHE